MPKLSAAVAALTTSDTLIRHAQRKLSAIIDAELFAVRLANATPVHQAHWRSAGVQYAGTWLCPSAGDENPIWLAPASFIVLLRHRFALPLSATPAALCAFCGVAGIVDVYGLHSLLCTSGGSRWALHNALRDQLYFILRDCNWSPRLEVQPFATHPSLRLDIVVTFGPGSPRHYAAIDVSVISPLAQA
jgi:hypothetical protein